MTTSTARGNPAPTRPRQLPKAAAAAVALTALATAASALAQDVFRVGKTAPNALAFTMPEVGAAKGIWARHNIEVKVLQYAGDAKMQQGLVAGEIEVGLGSGPGMGFIAKGVPAKAVGVIANEPLSMGLMVRGDGRIKSLEQLKGSRVGITTNGSLTYWLARELSRQMGWGSDGIRTVPMGALTAQIAGLKSGQVDGFIMSASVGYMLAEKKEAEVLLHFGDKIGAFHTHVFFATNRIIKDKPDAVRRFLAAWAETVAWMRANKDEAVPLASKASGIPVAIQATEFDKVMPMMSRDMRFQETALAVLADSFVEMEILDRKPDMRTLYTEEFLPARK